MKIKSINVRCNKEYAPYQHVRVELSASLDKDDDLTLARAELAAEAQLFVDAVTQNLVRLQLHRPSSDQPQEQELTPTDDSVPY